MSKIWTDFTEEEQIIMVKTIRAELLQKKGAVNLLTEMEKKYDIHILSQELMKFMLEHRELMK